VRGDSWAGALVSLLAASLPCSVMAVAVTVFYELWSRNRWAQVALHGALAAAVGIVVYTSWHLTRMNLRPSTWARVATIFLGSVILHSLFSVSPLRVLFDMNAFVLFLVLLKATVTTFNGLASLPILRDELVLKRHVLMDQQLNMDSITTWIRILMMVLPLVRSRRWRLA
jgi:chromate transport protein ChrA